MLSNSMIVRDAELVLQNMESDIKVISNRGQMVLMVSYQLVLAFLLPEEGRA